VGMSLGNQSRQNYATMDAKLVPVSGRIFQLLLGLFPHQLPVMPENKVLARVSKSDELPNPVDSATSRIFDGLL